MKNLLQCGMRNAECGIAMLAAMIAVSTGAMASDLLVPSPTASGGFPGQMLQRFSTNGVFGGTFATGVQNPIGVAVGPTGNVYVSCGQTHDIAYYSARGLYMGRFGSGNLVTPEDLAFGPDGDLYVCDSGGTPAVRRFHYSGTTWTKISDIGVGSLLRPHGLCFGPDGALYIADPHDSSYQPIWSSSKTNGYSSVQLVANARNSGLDTPYDVAIGPDGKLYVSSYVTGEIHRYSFDAYWVYDGRFASGAPNAAGIAFTASNVTPVTMDKKYWQPISYEKYGTVPGQPVGGSRFQTDSHTKLLLHLNNTLADSSGNAYAVAASGSPYSWATEGPMGGGIRLSGSACLVVPTPAWSETTGTFEAWVKFDGFTAGENYILDVGSNPSDIRLTLVGRQDSWRIGVMWKDVNGNSPADAFLFFPAPFLHTWHHFALCWSDYAITTFIDGKLVGARATKGGAKVLDGSYIDFRPKGDQYVTIGGNGPGPAPSAWQLNGVIEEVRISDIVRYTNEFQVDLGGY